MKGVCVSLDGKAVRRACAKGAGAPVVETAWADGADVPFGEMRVGLRFGEEGLSRRRKGGGGRIGASE